MKEEEQEKQEEEEKREGEEEKTVSVWDCGSPLYDSFEIASVCHLLDRHLMVLPFSKGSRRLTEQSEARKVVIMGNSWNLRGKNKAKKIKAGFREIISSIAFWRKH